MYVFSYSIFSGMSPNVKLQLTFGQAMKGFAFRYATPARNPGRRICHEPHEKTQKTITRCPTADRLGYAAL